MKLKSTIAALLVGLSLLGAACGLSQDEKYKLALASTYTGDQKTMDDVFMRLGLLKPDGRPDAATIKFIDDMNEWSKKSPEFFKEIDTREKAKEYVKNHMP